MLLTIYESFRTLPCPINPPWEIIWYEAGDAQQIQIFSWAGCGLFSASVVIHFPRGLKYCIRNAPVAPLVSTVCEVWLQHELCTLLVYYSFKPHSLDFDCFSSRWRSPTHFLIRQLASPSGALLLCPEPKEFCSQHFTQPSPKDQRSCVCIVFCFFCGRNVYSHLQTAEDSALWHHPLYKVLPAQWCGLCPEPHSLVVPHIHLLAYIQRVFKARG